MKRQILAALIMQMFISACGQDNSMETNLKYGKYKSSFEPKFFTQFPLSVEKEFYKLASSENDDKNKIGLWLYEYALTNDELIKIKDGIFNKIIARYKPTDSCLLIVNRFETKETDRNRETPKITDSSLVNRSCYEGRYPIPNFIEYENPDAVGDLWKDSTFVIYVLESGHGKYLNKYELKPSPQMPDKWKNGYSKGIALSEERKMVIYWSIAW